MMQTLVAKLKSPLVALAITALLSQQIVGLVLTATPTLAAESGLSLCLTGKAQLPDSGEGSGGDTTVGFCPCTLTGLAGLLTPSADLAGPDLHRTDGLATRQIASVESSSPTGSPPVRAPPARLHT